MKNTKSSQFVAKTNTGFIVARQLRNPKGFTLVELLIAGAVIAIAFTAIVGFLLFSQNITLKSQRNTEAVGLAEQAMEAVRKLRDDSWTSNIATLTVGTTYYPSVSGNQWTLVTINPNSSSYYTTKIVLSDVNRDSNDNISAAGTNDPNTKKVVTTVSWSDSGTRSAVLTTYITNFKQN